MIIPQDCGLANVVFSSSLREEFRPPNLVYMSKKGNMIWRCSELLKANNVDENLLQMDYEIFNALAKFTGKLILYSARD